MFASVLSSVIVGLDVCPVQVEADVSDGLPGFIMVGFPSVQVKEAQDRVRTAMHNSGFRLPPKKVTVN
ncbi:MAG: magnesium chelatase, partial [Blautia sp.]|nr:magnesium chelatase [Blautia sp.]